MLRRLNFRPVVIKRYFAHVKDNRYTLEIGKTIEAQWTEKICMSQKEIASKPKYYVLSMFPYPSGNLHMGHVRVYVISDVMARFKKMRGYQVIHPMGWDAFGLPAENAARHHNMDPDVWTYSNIKRMKKQIKDLSCSFDWDREITTCDPEYYHWTQYLFLKLFDAGLVYQKQAMVNWDPVDKTVLADEQISEEGLSWRSGSKVEKKFLRQWFIKMSSFAQNLVKGLEQVNSNSWRHVLKIQRNWIGECSGTQFQFAINDGNSQFEDPLPVFTDCPEYLSGVAFIALSPGHYYDDAEFHQDDVPLDDDIILLKLKATNPMSGDNLPVVVSKLHRDEHRDSFLGLPIISAIDQKVLDKLKHLAPENVFRNSECTFPVNEDELENLRRSVLQRAKDGGYGGEQTSSKLRDWLISRQRFWGTPIPIIHCPNCKVVPVPYDQLPVISPPVKEATKQGILSLSNCEHWKTVTCPKCGSLATRETDTMDTFVDSSWYFLRYLDPTNKTEPFNKLQVYDKMPVDLYIGGLEHALLHLLYARFISHFLHSQGYLKQTEPFVNLLTQGMVMSQAYKVKGTGQYLPKEHIDFTGSFPKEKNTEAEVEVSWEKMSKSKFNGVDPQELLLKYGSDATRLCILSGVAPKSDRHWSSNDFVGVFNFQRRVWDIVMVFIDQKSSCQVLPKTSELEENDKLVFDSYNFILKEVTFHLHTTFLLSTAISRIHSLANTLMKTPVQFRAASCAYEKAVATLIVLISPFCPCFASHLWQRMAAIASPSAEFNWETNVLDQKWPEVDPSYRLPLCIELNRSTFGKIFLPRQHLDTLTKDDALNLVQQDVNYREISSNVTECHFELIPSVRATLWLEKKI